MIDAGGVLDAVGRLGDLPARTREGLYVDLCTCYWPKGIMPRNFHKQSHPRYAHRALWEAANEIPNAVVRALANLV